MSGQGNFEKQAEKPTSTEAPKTSGTQHHPAEVNNMGGWATILARLATILARWAPDWLPIGWIGNRLANEAPIGNRDNGNIQGDYGNIQGDYGRQANNYGNQFNNQGDNGKQANNPAPNTSPTAPAPATAQMPTPAPAPAPTSGIQNSQGNYGNIQGNFGEQSNNYGNQFNNQGNGGTQVNNHGDNGTQNIQGDNGKQANNSGTQHQPKFTF